VLVAQKIFGIEVEGGYSPGDISEILPKQPFRKGEPRTCLGPMAHPILNTICEYSTDVSVAWQVVEEMKDIVDDKGNQLLCCLKICCDIPGEVWDIHWSYSELSTMDDGHKDHQLPLSWHSFPEAICKAALLIREEERG